MAKQPLFVSTFRYRIDQLSPEETVLDAYPDLQNYANLVEYGSGENDGFLRYAILMSEGTNLHRTYADFSERKKEALRLAGIPEDHERYQSAFDLSDPGTRVLRWTWLKAFSSRKFRAYISICAAYDQNCMLVEQMAKEADFEALALQNEILDRLEHELFFGDEQMQQVAEEQVEMEKPLSSWEDLIFAAAKNKELARSKKA